ncbi:hypothetical protein DPMN_025167 [Dreissena polymorpha]|uniref:Uncharacterized protein n=1 Tax=Dreissena polymorpha TaxID=45954 RepID=A0A9D4RBF3_DREPO|nr:hypothetical protein DPMN_025167 [Dreissena polymorpha]
MLRYSVKTWPSNKTMTINSIDTISRALAATLSNKDYANMNTTVSLTGSNSSQLKNEKICAAKVIIVNCLFADPY